MCEPISMGIMAAASIYGAIESQDQQRMAMNRQKQAMAKQDEAQAVAEESAAKLGPAAKSIDLSKDASAYQEAKRNKVAMQQGIMGTIKSNPMAQTSATPTAKATLGI